MLNQYWKIKFLAINGNGISHSDWKEGTKKSRELAWQEIHNPFKIFKNML